MPRFCRVNICASPTSASALFGWRPSAARYCCSAPGRSPRRPHDVGEHDLGADDVAATGDDGTQLVFGGIILAALDHGAGGGIILTNAGTLQRCLPARLVQGIGCNGARQQAARFSSIALSQANQPETTQRVGILWGLREHGLERGLGVLRAAGIQGSKAAGALKRRLNPAVSAPDFAPCSRRPLMPPSLG